MIFGPDCIIVLFSLTQQICDRLVDWIQRTPFSGIKYILKPLRLGIPRNALDTHSISLIVQKLGTIMKSLCAADTDVLIAIALILKEVWKFDRDGTVHIETVINQFLPFIQSVPLEEEQEGDEEEDEMEATEAIPAITELVFYLCATATRSIDIDMAILDDLLSLATRGISNEALISMCMMVRNSNVMWDDDLVFKIMSFITEMALNEKIEPALLTEIKYAMQEVLDNDRVMRRRITSPFMTSRSKMDKFEELLA